MASDYDIAFFPLIRQQVMKEMTGVSQRIKRWTLRRRIQDRLAKNNITSGKHNIYNTPWSVK